VIGPEGGAWSEGAAGVDVLVMSSVVSSSHSSCKMMQNLCFGLVCTLFQGTEVAKHPFYSIRPQMMFGSVSEHFANIRHVKDAKLVFRACMHYFRVPKLRSIHSFPLDPK
jgi:hypothetical protein